MSVGALISDLRRANGWSQGGLADTLCLVSGHPTLTREDVHRWETGKVIPGKFWLAYLATVLDVPLDVMTAEAKLSRMKRREFLSLSALAVAHRKVATELTASIAGGDAGPLAVVQTTHGTDLVIAAITDKSSSRRLHGWMTDGETPVLRVNAAGILAKIPGQGAAEDVAMVLGADPDLRRLYSTAVIARAAALPWDMAARIADGTTVPTQKQANFLAMRLSREVLNPRDAGARWCSAVLLRDLSPVLRLPDDGYSPEPGVQ